MKKRMLYAVAVVSLVLAMTLPMVTPVMASEIELKKNTEPISPNTYYLGDVIEYVLEVGNPLSNAATNYLDLVEDILPTLPYASNVTILATNVTQAPDESNLYYCNYTVLESDLQFIGGRWRVMNYLHAEGTDSLDDIIDATTSKSSIILRPAISIDKTVDFDNDAVFTDLETYYAGEPADWKIIVTNTGYDPVYNITVSDDNMGVDFYGPFDLAVNESRFVPVYTTYPTADFLNTACAQGVDEIGGTVGPVCDPAEVLVIEPDTEVTIDASAYTVLSGDTVDLTVTESNTGDDPLTNVSVTVEYDSTTLVVLDETTAIEDMTNDNILEVGETWTWDASTDTELDDFVVNAFTTFTATGYGEDSLGNPVTIPDYPDEEDTVDVDTFQPNTITTIISSAATVSPGDTVDLTVTEENTGGDPLTNPYVEVRQGATLIATLDETTPGWISDINGDAVLDVGETWSWTITSGPITAATTFEALGFGTDSLLNEVSFATGYYGERDTVRVEVRGEGCLEICKFQDSNVNGMWDPGEPYLPDWKFHVTGPAGYDTWVTTGPDGCVVLLDLTSGTYTVTEELKAGWYNTKPGGDAPYKQKVTVGISLDCARVTFGNREEIRDIPPTVPAMNEWGIIAMITVFAGLLVWTVRRKRLAL